MLEWRDEVTSHPSPQSPVESANATDPGQSNQAGAEVMVLIWPAGDFVRLPRGTTAGQIVHDQVSSHSSPSPTMPGWAFGKRPQCQEKS